MDSPGRAAAAAAAAELVEPGMTIGLGSGRAVWATLELLRGRDVRAAAASSRTEELLRDAGIPVVELDGGVRLQLAIDGADEIDPDLGLIKGGGAAMLREKLVVKAADRFVVVAEATKKVGRLGQTRRLPVEVVRFAWRDTQRRLLSLVPAADLRHSEHGDSVVTDEGHYILDCELPGSGDLGALGQAIKAEVGVVEHGLFIGMTSLALLGKDDGSVECVSAY
ncbi:MAG TPA: ribose-5-phosphate isomerase RpiA [Thermoleophilaceae bacterium]|nr:ribose-5-phosphate isomerase RpiA [Thermoleophilaceae bacterium]